MMRADEVIEKYFGISNNEMLIGSVGIDNIVQHFGTPIYVYDIDVLKRNYTDLATGLPDQVALYFSLKANPSLGICSSFHQLGAGAEIASLGEYKTALEAGFLADKIIFGGPGKSIGELETAIDHNILSINVESIDEITAIEQIACRLRRTPSISIRVNPEQNVTHSHQKMGGVASPFGIDEEMLPEVVRHIKNLERVKLVGIHVYVGNQIFDYMLAIENIKNTIRIARKVSSIASINKLKLVNFGGGLGIPYYEKQNYFQEALFQKGLNQYIQTIQSEPLFKTTTFILELGRYLVARCGVFLTRVLYLKDSRGKRFAVVDGGMNINSIATGNFGQKLRRRFLLCAPKKLDQNENVTYDIVGPLCTPMDTFGHDYRTPPLQTGDIIAVLFVGAYGLTGSPVHFLSHLACSEIGISNGKMQIMRQKETMAHLISQQSGFLLESIKENHLNGTFSK